MNPIVKDFLSFLAREIAGEVAKQISKPKEPAPGAEDIGKAAELFKPEAVAPRSEKEWRDDCLEIINLLAPTHGRKLRELLAKFDAKRLGEVPVEHLPTLLTELVMMKDA